jgi:hypothetical protein
MQPIVNVVSTPVSYKASGAERFLRFTLLSLESQSQRLDFSSVLLV